jgi:type IV pilus assembly protein PilB
MALSLDVYKKIFVDSSPLLTGSQFEKITKNSQQTHRPIEQLLMERAFISPAQLIELLSIYFEVPATELKIRDISADAVSLIPEAFATEHGLIAFSSDGESLKVAFVDPSHKEVLDQLQQLTNLIIKPYVAREFAIKRALVLYDGSIDDIVRKLFDRPATASQDSINTEQLSRSIIETAIMLDASDVHIEPFETELIIRFRIDGAVRTIASLPISLHQSMVAYLKISGEMKIDQKRLPQDGRFSINAKGQEVNIRMSTVPSLWGEKVVLRVLPKVNGFEVLKTIKADPALANIPVIVLSNLSQVTDEVEVRKLGAIDFLIKSDYSLKQIIEKVESVFSTTS